MTFFPSFGVEVFVRARGRDGFNTNRFEVVLRTVFVRIYIVHMCRLHKGPPAETDRRRRRRVL